MLNYKTATNGEINYNGIVVKEISPTIKLNLRGKKLFIPMENKNISVIVSNTIFFDEENKRINA